MLAEIERYCQQPCTLQWGKLAVDAGDNALSEAFSMTIRANVSRGYLMRLGLVGLFCAAGGGWFLYDGLVTYPNQRIRAEEFKKFTEENPEMEELERINKWNEMAREKGWPEGNPGEPFKDYDINEQFYYAGAAGLAALGFLSRFLFMLGRWIESDDSMLRDKAGRETSYANITELNKKKWQSKGIAFVGFKKVDGTPDRIRLDDFYFEREPTRQILRQVEANIDPALITNGKPEPPEKVADDSEGSA